MTFLPILQGVLDTRAGFQLSALLVSWIAIGFLVLVVANLHSRLRRVEARSDLADARPGPAHQHLIGRRLGDILEAGSAAAPRLLILLSRSCSSCSRLLNDLRRDGRRESAAIAWIDETPSPLPALPSNARVVGDGPRIARDLGVRVTPFALVADESGRIVSASPLNDLDKLDLAIRSPAIEDGSHGLARNPDR